MVKTKKIFKIVCIVVLVGVVSYLVFSFIYRPKSLIGKGDGEDYAISDISELVQLANYSYSDSEDSIWDFYSVEYDVKVFSIQYDEELLYYNDYYGRHPLKTTYTLTEIENVDVKGKMAHNKGLYYIREEGFGLTIEFLIDVVNDCFAYCLSGSFIYKILEYYEQINTDVAEVAKSYFGKWVCFDVLSSDYARDILELVNHFYDSNILALLEKEELFDIDGEKYVLKNTTSILSNPLLIDCFYFEGYEFYNVELTKADVRIDLKDGKTPNVNYSLKAYIKDVDKSIDYEGNIKYNYINNTKINVPQEVIGQWSEYEGFNRVFD